MSRYQPSNGTEGEIFESKFCRRCKHGEFLETGMSHDPDHCCDIWARTIFHNPKDPEYPDEWQRTEDGIFGICTAFEEDPL